MNLQICVPYEECPFKCPMCIASERHIFLNKYKGDYDFYIDRLYRFMDNIDLEDVVLTGNTEPTLNKRWLTNIAKEIKMFSQKTQIELQTKNYNLKNYNLSNIDVLSYSITNSKEYLQAWNFRKIPRTNRLVILLTKEFEFLTAENFNTFGFEQITFKVLQFSINTLHNDWIEENMLEDLTEIYKIVDRFNGTNTSVRVDTSCQDSEGRYMIFREDGELYNSWESEEPL